MPPAPDPLRPGRLKRRAEFRRLSAHGRKAPMPGLVLQALPRDGGGPDGDRPHGDGITGAQPARLGFTVTKKIGNAVVRNRTRRRLKEAARLWLREHPVCGVDLVLIGREGTRKRDFRKLQDDLRRALEKTGVPAKAGAT